MPHKDRPTSRLILMTFCNTFWREPIRDRAELLPENLSVIFWVAGFRVEIHPHI
jgi:hypothetical protein